MTYVLVVSHLSYSWTRQQTTLTSVDLRNCEGVALEARDPWEVDHKELTRVNRGPLHAQHSQRNK